jgi:putative pre-16S rRNA nuclease
VGLPLNMDGTEGRGAHRARAFANHLSASVNLPVELFDERLTSFEAEVRLRGSGSKRGAKSKAALDAVAAAVILESWIASHPDSGARG